MAESTASIDYWDVLDDISYSIGWGTEHTDAGNLAKVRRYAEQGLLQFLAPPPADASKEPHVWSFLHPIATITLRTQKESGTATVSGTTVTDSSGEFLSYGVEAGDTIQFSDDGGTTYESETVASITSETVLEVTVAPSGGNGSYTYYVDEEAWRYPLPDDFGSMAGSHLLVYDRSQCFSPFPIRDQARVRAMHAHSDTTGRPHMAAIRPKSFDSETGQRWELLIYPDPDDDYVVEYPYNVLLDKWGETRATGTGAAFTHSTLTLGATGIGADATGTVAGDKVIVKAVGTSTNATGIYVVASVTDDDNIVLTASLGADDSSVSWELLPAKLYPPGGNLHGETIRASCLAISELFEDDANDTRREYWKERLVVSVGIDQRMNPRNYGYMRDGSDGLRGRQTTHDATYEGSTYGPYGTA